jgi:hypothetical protein
LKGIDLDKMYQPEFWHEAFVVIGTGAAALAGLVIVAASVRADLLMSKPHLRMRARNNTLSMISIVGGSVLVLLPQGAVALGVELIVFNLAWSALPVSVILYERKAHPGLSLRLPTLALSFYLLAALGGVSLILDRGGGLYLILAAYFGYLLVAVLNAYLLLLPKAQA